MKNDELGRFNYRQIIESKCPKEVLETIQIYKTL